MADAVTVFVDDAVLGLLPPVCVKTGAVTEDRLTQQLQIGDRSLGIAWLLILFGPVGWVVLLVLSLTRRPLEELRVILPMTEAAYQREVAARKSFRIAAGLAVLGAIALYAALFPWHGTPVERLLLTAAAALTCGYGVVGMFVSHGKAHRASVELGLDASRRWVTIWGVHPNFVAAVNREPFPEPAER